MTITPRLKIIKIAFFKKGSLSSSTIKFNTQLYEKMLQVL